MHHTVMGRQVCVRVPAGTVPGTWYGNWGHGSVIGVYGVQVLVIRVCAKKKKCIKHKSYGT